jgi:hypothetical protein
VSSSAEQTRARIPHFSTGVPKIEKRGFPSFVRCRRATQFENLQETQTGFAKSGLQRKRKKKKSIF